MIQRKNITLAALWANVYQILGEENTTYDQFVQLAQAGELTNPRLRDLWLLAGPFLLDNVD